MLVDTKENNSLPVTYVTNIFLHFLNVPPFLLSSSFFSLSCFPEIKSCYIVQPCPKFGTLLSSPSESWLYDSSSGWVCFYRKTCLSVRVWPVVLHKGSFWNYWNQSPTLSTSHIGKEWIRGNRFSNYEHFLIPHTSVTPPILFHRPCSHVSSNHIVNINSELISSF